MPLISPIVPKQLSKSEQKVLNLLVEGQSNIEIASTLYLSPNTIKTHVRDIFNKLGVENRVQAAVFALRHGLVNDTEASMQ
jgi:DNA-binding NarL/FixJ family response regulator